MGECSFIQSIKGVFQNVPSICMNGIKLSEHLGQMLNQLDIDMKNEAEIDVMIFVFCNLQVNPMLLIMSI